MPATRMPSMSAAVLMGIVIAGIIASAALESRVSTGGRAAARLDRPRCPAASTCITSRAAMRSPTSGPRPARTPRTAVDRIESIRARYVHLVWSDAPLAGASSTAPPALLRYGEPFVDDGRADARPGRRAAARHRLAVGLEGDRHRPQLRPRGAAHRARHRVPLGLKRGLLGGAQGAGRGRARRRRRAAARPHDRERARRPRAASPTCSTSGRREPLVTRRRARRRRGAGPRPTANSAWRCPTTRSTTCTVPSTSWAATRPTSS